MSTIALLNELKNKGIDIRLYGDDLKVNYNGEELPGQVIDVLKKNKQDIISFLKKRHRPQRAEIPVVPYQQCYPLSSAQYMIWILSQFEEGSIAYNMSGDFVFEGELQYKSLVFAFQALIERHEILRTVFKPDDQGEIKQFIVSASDLDFNMQYWDLRTENCPEEHLRDILRQESVRPFNLVSGPLIRAGVLQVSDHKWIFTYKMHHIISDGWSMNILLSEVLQQYKAHSKGETISLLPLRIQYKDYAVWQNNRLNESALKDYKAYWLKQFEGELPVLAFPADKPRPAVKTYQGAMCFKIIDKHLTRKLKNLSQELGGTLFMGLLALVNTLLYRYTNQEDIVTGTSIAGREHADTENQIGLYLNTLALRMRFKGANSFRELFEQIKITTLQAYDHQLYPFDELVNSLKVQRDMSRSVLFDVMVLLQNIKVDAVTEQQNPDELKVSEYTGSRQLISKFDLTFTFLEKGENIHAAIEYNSDIFHASTLERLGMHLEQLLKAVLDNPSTPIGQYDFLNAGEKHTLLVEFNDTAAGFAKNKNILNLFEEQVAKTPSRPAVVYGQKILLYAHLNKRANQLAAYLRDKYKVGPDDLVGIKLDRSDWMVIAIFGVLKSGGAYVTIDPEYPQDRIDHILADSGCKVLIDHDELDMFIKEAHIYEDVNQAPVNTLNDLAYVIYTSGSTGVPKGCAITHGNLFNYIQWATGYYFNGLSSPDFGLFTSLSFDLTVTSIFCPLVKGGTLTVFSQAEELTSILISSFRQEANINCIKLTPSHISILKHLNIRSSTMQKVIVGGEEVTPEQVSILKNIHPYIEIFNEYGPTETTVGCIVKQLEEGKPVLIGKPIAETGIYIVDDEFALCPPGVVGEICIGGAGVARGYLNKPELTAEKFVSNPFKGNEKIYRTGDLGRWLPDGNIAYLGRKDEQVKIRGFRIEPGEIETALQSHPAIESAVVITRHLGIDNSKELVAYFKSNELMSITLLRAYLSGILPPYMIPGYFIQVDVIPLTTNGKVNRKALPHPLESDTRTGTEHVEAAGELEQKVLSVWQKILGIERIGVTDNFFDLGGNSVKLVNMIGLINRTFGTAIPIVQAFKFPTIKILAEHLHADASAPEATPHGNEADASFSIMAQTFRSLNYAEHEH